MIVADKATTRKEVSRGEVRERMQPDLVVRGMSPRTQEAYRAAVKGLAQYDPQPPDTLTGPSRSRAISVM